MASGPYAAEAPVADVVVVLIVLDGVRWQEIFHGVDKALAPPTTQRVSAEKLVPNLWQLARRGGLIGDVRRGDHVVASGPNYVSLPGYNEIFSGRPSSHCRDNACPPTPLPTVVDDVEGEVAIISSWESIPKAATAWPDRLAISAGSGPASGELAAHTSTRVAAEAVRRSGPWPGEGHYRPDTLTARLALDWLSARAPKLMFVGLGDTDEHAHRGNYAGYLRALEDADRFIGAVRGVLARFERHGLRTALVVTTDHGRAANFRDHGGEAPESAHVWIAFEGSQLDAAPAPSAHQASLSSVAPLLRFWLAPVPPPGSVALQY